jgi:hypothetical protein
VIPDVREYRPGPAGSYGLCGIHMAGSEAPARTTRQPRRSPPELRRGSGGLQIGELPDSLGQFLGAKPTPYTHDHVVEAPPDFGTRTHLTWCRAGSVSAADQDQMGILPGHGRRGLDCARGCGEDRSRCLSSPIVLASITSVGRCVRSFGVSSRRSADTPLLSAQQHSRPVSFTVAR